MENLNTCFGGLLGPEKERTWQGPPVQSKLPCSCQRSRWWVEDPHDQGVPMLVPALILFFGGTPRPAGFNSEVSTAYPPTHVFRSENAILALQHADVLFRYFSYNHSLFSRRAIWVAFPVEHEKAPRTVLSPAMYSSCFTVFSTCEIRLWIQLKVSENIIYMNRNISYLMTWHFTSHLHWLIKYYIEICTKIMYNQYISIHLESIYMYKYIHVYNIYIYVHSDYIYTQ